MTVKEALEQADFFRAAGAGSRDEIAGFAYIRRFGKGAHVFYDREESTCIFWWREWRPCIRLIPWERKRSYLSMGREICSMKTAC